jgi:hypothetical protein
VKRFLPLVLALVTGCSTQFNPAAPRLYPAKDLQHDPLVVFVGDSITHNWLASGTPSVLKSHPMWIDKSSTTLENISLHAGGRTLTP